jgi:hypothetical protein
VTAVPNPSPRELTAGQVLDALHALGATTIPDPDHTPGPADLPTLLGYLAATIERAQVEHLMPDTTQAYLEAYGDGMAEDHPQGRVIGREYMTLAMVRTTRQVHELNAFLAPSPLTRLAVEAQRTTASALALIAQSKNPDLDLAGTDLQDTLKTVGASLQGARRAYGDMVRMTDTLMGGTL